MKQLWAPELRKKRAPQLLTIPVHKACNSAYQHDEDYFVKAILPFLPNSYAGNVLFRKTISEYHRGRNRLLMQKVLREFDPRPSGLALPNDKIAKRFEGARISRVVWKIVRGLHFHHTNQVLPTDWTTSVALHLLDRTWRPLLHFLAFMQEPDNPPHGKDEGVFCYRYKKFPKANDLHYWALLVLDSVLLIVAFHDLDCSCGACGSKKRETLER
jgi:hypothetical protein